MLVAGLFNQVAPPQVATLFPLDIAAGTLEDHDVADALHVRVFQRFINVFLQRNAASRAHAFIGGDHQF
ncbi:hypothetical protein D3C80_1890370 [compost metagenome]